MSSLKNSERSEVLTCQVCIDLFILRDMVGTRCGSPLSVMLQDATLEMKDYSF